MSTGLTYFDCHATVGPRHNMHAGERHTLADLLESMDRCGIDAALVGSTYAQTYDVMWANQQLAQSLQDQPRLFPVWTALPHQAGDMPAPAAFVRAARAAGVRAVRLYPHQHAFDIGRGTLGSLMTALVRARLPILSDRGQFLVRQDDRVAGYRALQEFCTLYRRSAVLFLGAHWGDVRLLLPVMDACPNLHIELSTLQYNLAPERLVARYGAERILFGSGGPSMCAGAARALIDWADLRLADRQKIAARNLCRLLGIRKLPIVEKRPADDPVAAVWQGKPLTQVDVIDAHAHINHAGANGVGTIIQPEGHAAGMRRLFTRIGIRRTAVSSWLGIMAPDAHLGNDITHAAMQAEPDFVIGYACMDPAVMTAGEIEAEIALRHDQQGFLGLKPYIRTSAKFDHPGYAPWYRYAARRRLFALFHDSHELAARLADAYPGLQVLLAHSGGSIASARRNGDLAHAHANVFCEITLTPVTNGAIELMAGLAGAERVLFGTDAPMRDPRPQLGWAVHAALQRADKVKILGGNFTRILAGIRPPRAHKARRRR